jgi:uncharacterized protein (TIGR03437 family)
MIGGHYQNVAFFVTKPRACEQGNRWPDQALVRVEALFPTKLQPGPKCFKCANCACSANEIICPSSNTMRLLIGLTALAFGCAASLGATPVINGIINAASWLPTALPNSGIAQGAMFIVSGSGLGPSTLQSAHGYPLPTTEGLAGTTIKVEVAGVIETCPMLYTYTGQVAAVLPSPTPIGTGTLTLSYKDSSSAFAIQVVAASFGTFALNEDGSGPGIFTDLTYHVITMTNAAHPGQTLVIWGSGLGAITAPDDQGSPIGNLDVGEVKVLIGNQLVTPIYAGRSGYPAEDQIDFTIPAGITPACKTTVAVVVKGVTGNVTTISIAPEGQTTCGDTFNALTAANLQKAVSTGSLNLGAVELSHVAGHDDTLGAAFLSFPTDSLIRSFGGTTSPSIGNCIAYETYAPTLNVTDPIQPTFLHTGTELTLTGPNGNKNIPEFSTGIYADILASAAPFYLSPGDYTVTNGAGGSNVDSFTWNLTLPTAVVPTNLPVSINATQDLTLTWTGGSAFQFVTIFGYSAVPVTLTDFSWVEFICTADASAGSFTIPYPILKLLPTNGYGAFGVPGVSLQIAGVAESHFTVAGSPGINDGVFTAFIATGAIATVEQ